MKRFLFSEYFLLNFICFCMCVLAILLVAGLVVSLNHPENCKKYVSNDTIVTLDMLEASVEKESGRYIIQIEGSEVSLPIVGTVIKECN